MVFPLEGGSAGRREITFWVLLHEFSIGGWLRRPGGQGGFRPPPYAPLDPLYPLQTAEGYPRTPLVPEGALPLVARPTGSVSGTPFGLVLGQQPIGCQGGHALCPAPWPQHVLPQGIPAVTVPCHHSKDRPAPGSRGRDQLRRRRQWPSQGTDVNPAGRAPARLAVHCFLATGGPGAATPTCTLWPPPAPFGYFPARGKYLVRPQADETSP